MRLCKAATSLFACITWDGTSFITNRLGGKPLLPAEASRRQPTVGMSIPLMSNRAAFGANKFKAVPPKNFFKLWFGNLQDPTLIMLMIAALVGQPCRRCRPPRRCGTVQSSAQWG